MPEKVTAIVPMRNDSERVPGKNFRSFAGRPLYHHVIMTLLACPQVERVVIDTDSPFIMRDATEHFPPVELIERPLHLRSGDTPMNEVLLHAVKQLEAKWYLQTHSTNPLLRAGTVGAALDRFFGSLPRYDSLFSVTAVRSRFWNVLGRPINHDPMRLQRTQDMDAIYEENSNLYVFSGESLVRRGNRIGENPLMFEMERAEAVDIDEEVDFQFAELLYLQRERMF